jgi:hypothetical protein
VTIERHVAMAIESSAAVVQSVGGVGDDCELDELAVEILELSARGALEGVGGDTVMSRRRPTEASCSMATASELKSEASAPARESRCCRYSAVSSTLASPRWMRV